MPRQTDVVIVGAGPVGLWLACELRLAGVEVCLIERRTERTDQSRALTVHGRTLELFALRGILDRFTAHGMKLPAWHFAGLKTQLQFGGVETQCPYVLFLAQAKTEALIEAHAVELGVDLFRGHVVDHVEAGDGTIHVSGSADGKPFAFASRYLVGADGTRSVVRRAAGIDFSGTDASYSAMMADLLVDLPEGRHRLDYFVPLGALTILPLGDGVQHRVIYLDPDRDSSSGAPTLEELKASITKLAGTDYNMREPSWLSSFGDETRLASAYRTGNIFVVGDAAHMHAPMGGQGMNVGIQDAMNLGWKLAAVLKGQAPPALLDTFQAERHPIGERLAKNTMAQSRLISAFDETNEALREIVEEFIRNPDENARLAAEAGGFAAAYPEPLLDMPASALTGMRIPDEEIELSSGVRAMLYEQMHEGLWLHLSLEKGASVELPSGVDATAIKFVQARRLAGEGILANVGAILIRPDGHCAGAVTSLTEAA